MHRWQIDVIILLLQEIWCTKPIVITMNTILFISCYFKSQSSTLKNRYLTGGSSSGGGTWKHDLYDKMEKDDDGGEKESKSRRSQERHGRDEHRGRDEHHGKEERRGKDESRGREEKGADKHMDVVMEKHQEIVTHHQEPEKMDDNKPSSTTWGAKGACFYVNSYVTEWLNSVKVVIQVNHRKTTDFRVMCGIGEMVEILLIPYIGNFLCQEILSKMTLGRCV